MKTPSILTICILSTFIPHLSTAQGSLTPPAGPPVASMKTLDQVEARTPLVTGAAGVAIDGAGTITISQPGSYFLTGNRTITIAGAKGIVISSDGVTLDLNGFSLICTTGAGGHAISGSGSGLHILNGNIRGGTTVSGTTFSKAGWDSGVSVSGWTARVSHLSVTGVRGNGVDAGFDGSTVERVGVSVCGGRGIVAGNVFDSTVRAAAGHGILCDSASDAGGVVNNCSAEALLNSSGGGSAGIVVNRGIVSNSTGYSYDWYGVTAKTANHCQGVSSFGIGLAATTANNSAGKSGSDIGLSADTASNCQGESTSGGFGIKVTGTASFCRGTRTGGTAISAAIAVACTSGGGTITAPQKHLGTP